MAQDAKSRVKTTPKGRRASFARQRATCGSWRPSCTRSRTSPKLPFQNPSIAESACVWTIWDRGSLEGLREKYRLVGGSPPRFRGKSWDTGMLVWAARPPLARPPFDWPSPPHVSAANPGTPPCLYGRRRVTPASHVGAVRQGCTSRRRRSWGRHDPLNPIQDPRNRPPRLPWRSPAQLKGAHAFGSGL